MTGKSSARIVQKLADVDKKCKGIGRGEKEEGNLLDSPEISSRAQQQPLEHLESKV